MATRRAQAAVRRRRHHQARLRAATTDRARLRAACSWLIAEAVRTGRPGATTTAVLDLVHALRDGHPATDRAFDSIFDSTGPAPGTEPPTRGRDARAHARLAGEGQLPHVTETEGSPK